MKNYFCKRMQMLLSCLMMSCILFSCSDSDNDGAISHDPNRPITLDSFWPQEGPIATQVIIEGDNFGTNVEDITVLFNEKPATIISSNGDRMLVLAPKLPGEECVITVKVGSQSAKFKEIFDYIVQTSVSTVVGGVQAAAMPTGTVSLAAAQFSKKLERTMAIDSQDNLFFIVNGVPGGSWNNVCRIYMLNEEAGSIKAVHDLDRWFGFGTVGYSNKTDEIYWWGSQMEDDGYGVLSAVEDYASIHMGNIKFNEMPPFTNDMTCWGARSHFEMNPSDGKFYFFTNEGSAGRFDPLTGKGENLTTEATKKMRGDANGVVFDPRDNNIVYVAIKGKHCIFKYDMVNDTAEVWAGRENGAGHLDGLLTEAQFNEPCQMCCDGEAIYLADRGNHCIRKINLATGYVSTHAGVARTPGYVNGEADAAKFNYPVGCVIDSEGNLYVGDSENYAIRRVATE
ncbi:MAG: IPT/TIG domain-containing protein [Alistipes sp.]|nr:IPT/TIG domain-containing protein [Alistipes sp.]